MIQPVGTLAILAEISKRTSHIDDDAAAIRAALDDTWDGERMPAGHLLDLALPDVDALRVLVDGHPDGGKDAVVLDAALSRPPTALEAVELARDAYCACISLAGSPTNGAPFAFDQSMLDFCDLATTRIAEAARPGGVVAELRAFAPVAGVYVSYTAWWEGFDVALDGGLLTLKPHLGS